MNTWRMIESPVIYQFGGRRYWELCTSYFGLLFGRCSSPAPYAGPPFAMCSGSSLHLKIYTETERIRNTKDQRRDTLPVFSNPSLFGAEHSTVPAVNTRIYLSGVSFWISIAAHLHERNRLMRTRTGVGYADRFVCMRNMWGAYLGRMKLRRAIYFENMLRGYGFCH
jgi:hypothetical protein